MVASRKEHMKSRYNKVVKVYLDKTTYRALQKLCRDYGLTNSLILRLRIQDYLSKKGYYVYANSQSEK